MAEVHILCTPSFSKEEDVLITCIAKVLNVSREEAIRSAVQFFASSCVPTHNSKRNEKAA